jgi:hypothetical protein
MAGQLLNILNTIPFQNQVQWVMLFPYAPNISPYVESVTIPSYKFETDPQTKMVTDFNFLEDVTVTFREDQLGTVQAFLGIWEALTWDRDTKVFRDKQKYAKQMGIITMDEIHPLTPTLGWRMMGMRYKGMDTLSLSQGGDGLTIISANFSVEQVQPMFPLNGFGFAPIP